MNSSISFTSLIRPVSLSEFTKTSESIYNTGFVKHPWTAKETITSDKAFTMDVFDCSAGGIVDTNNKKVTLFHICPEIIANKDIEGIEQTIMKSSENIKDGIRAFMIGSNKMFQDSINMYNNIKSMITRRDIPLSELKGTRDKTHILYNAEKDEWLVTSSDINTKILKGIAPEKILADSFDEIAIDSGDTIAIG